MTRDETKKILMVVQAAFPNYNPPDKTVAVNVWHSFLQDFDYNSAQIALKVYISTDTSGFAPSIGQLIDCIYSTRKTDGLTEIEAWNLVREAISDGYYNASKGFDSLPKEVQKAVGGAGQIHAWSQCSTDHVSTIVQSAFIKSYRSVLKEKKHNEKVPKSVKMLLNGVDQSELEKDGDAIEKQDI